MRKGLEIPGWSFLLKVILAIGALIVLFKLASILLPSLTGWAQGGVQQINQGLFGGG